MQASGGQAFAHGETVSAVGFFHFRQNQKHEIIGPRKRCRSSLVWCSGMVPAFRKFFRATRFVKEKEKRIKESLPGRNENQGR